MHRIKTAALLVSSVFTLLTACKKTSTEDKPTPAQQEQQSGAVTNVGVPDGTPASKAVGAAGGSLTSADGKLKIDIPSGALSAVQTITIQPITNETPSGLKKAYRITPHDLQFAKPVTLVFPFTDDDANGTVPEALGIAYQGKDGIWKSVNSAKVDKAAKTVSVTTTHFSDWSLFPYFHLIPMEAVAPVGTTVDFKVVYVTPTDDLVVPIPTSSESPLHEEKELAIQYIKKWTMVGEGSLISRENKALYRAPDQVPQDNPVQVTVSLDLRNKGQYTIIGRVLVVDNEAIVVTASGGLATGKFVLAGVPMAQHVRSSNRTRVTAFLEGGTSQNSKTIQLLIPSREGFHLWDRESTVTCTYIVRSAGVQQVYNAHWSDVSSWHNSPGSVVVTHYGEVGEFITGRFTIEKSGYANGEKTFTPVAGYFAVRRLDDVPN